MIQKPQNTGVIFVTRRGTQPTTASIIQTTKERVKAAKEKQKVVKEGAEAKAKVEKENPLTVEEAKATSQLTTSPKMPTLQTILPVQRKKTGI